ncbi:galactokinase [Lipingzhangella sp. LS1_29]|uniref:Galactokinase n=1 Tax=Lipingzhangella rawalii TaxID=2055835 RepID=A0ABU2H3F7_9ACTN|nr:galactokinase [Lipingzhangella rawalii]MDS1269831.1 galactokinase [Lipingzhangella rawalii]
MFTATLGTAPTSVWHMPELASLLGEHTGPAGGLALPFALPWGPSVALDLTDSGPVEVHAPGREPLRMQHPAARVSSPDFDWAAPALRAVELLSEAGYISGGGPAGRGIRIVLDTTPTPGTAAATAVECAVLLALAETLGHDDLVAQPRQLAARTAAATPDASDPWGTLARSAAVRCRADHVLFLDTHTHGGRGLPLPLADHELCLQVVDTHPQAAPGRDGAPNDWPASCVEAAERLGVGLLREVAEEPDLGPVLQRVPQGPLRRRVRHMLTEIHRVNAAAGLLRMGVVAELGPLLNTAHLSLRDQLECSTAEVDLAVETAVHNGARGARLTGPGEAGRVLVLCPVPRDSRIREAISSAFAAKGWPEPTVRTVAATGGGPSRPL